MKTCLYKSVFINPLAYFVFPLLYNIEPKTDNYIEKAIYAGSLQIEVISSDKAPLLIYNNEIDFSSLAGLTVRINQYIDLGATVLGVWNIPEATVHPTLLSNELENKEEYGTDREESSDSNEI